MTGATLFSGIGAPEVALPWIDWRWCAEIERFPAAVMASRHPDIPNLGDVTAEGFIEKAKEHGPIDLLVFGSPCQSFSVAGKRLGLDDPRGNLALIALGIVAALAPTWFLFENVPGLFSNWSGGPEGEPDEGQDWEFEESSDFATFLEEVQTIGYSGAWSVLDAQYFGLAQRRDRLFFVGHSGDWRGPAAVLLEPESLSGNTPPRREAGERAAPTIAARTRGGGGLRTDAECDGAVIPTLEAGARTGISTDDPRAGIGIGAPDDPMYTLQSGKHHAVAFGGNRTSGPTDVATACNAKGGSGRIDFETETLVTHALRADGFDASEDWTGRGTPLTVFNLRGREGGAMPESADKASLRSASGGSSRSYIGSQHAVRRLTPRECERLQGFPDDYTLIEYRGKPAADGPRYKALGNAMAVPVIEWIGRRIAQLRQNDGFLGSCQA